MGVLNNDTYRRQMLSEHLPQLQPRPNKFCACVQLSIHPVEHSLMASQWVHSQPMTTVTQALEQWWERGTEWDYSYLPIPIQCCLMRPWAGGSFAQFVFEYRALLMAQQRTRFLFSFLSSHVECYSRLSNSSFPNHLSSQHLLPSLKLLNHSYSTSRLEEVSRNVPWHCWSSPLWRMFCPGKMGSLLTRLLTSVHRQEPEVQNSHSSKSALFYK